MKIERGIIISDEYGVAVRSPGHIYHLNHLDFYGPNLSDDQKVLGIIIENKFNIFREFITDTGEYIYGFLIRSSNPGIIQSIPEFDPIMYDPFCSIYEPGPQFQIPL